MTHVLLLIVNQIIFYPDTFLWSIFYSILFFEGSSGAINRGSRQSSVTQSASLMRGVTGTSIGTAPSLSNTAFSVPSPAPMQTVMTLNGVHPFHTPQSGTFYKL